MSGVEILARLVGLAALFLVAACSGTPGPTASAPPRNTASPTTSASGTLPDPSTGASVGIFQTLPLLPAGPYEPRPLNVLIDLDTSRAATALVPAEGGKLEAIGADGTRYTLTLPSTALLFDTEVTMTPIAGVTSFDNLGKEVEQTVPLGVDLEPDGLRLYDWATLEITPAGGNTAQRAAAFSYQGAGDQLHAYPLDLETDRLAMKLIHFSGRMIYLGDNIWVPAEESGPVDWEAQIEKEMADLFKEERDRQLNGEEPSADFNDRLQALMDTYYDLVVAPLLGRIETDCEFARANLHTPLSWARQAQLVGGDEADPRQQQVMGTAMKALENCWNQLKSRCIDNRDIEQVKVAISLARQGQLLGGSEEVFDPTFIFDSNSSTVCGDAFGTVVWKHDMLEKPSDSDKNREVRTRETMTVSVNLDADDDGGGWLDRGSSFSWVGSQLLTEQEGPCGVTNQSSWIGGGSFDGDKNSMSLSWDEEEGALLLSAAVEGEMVGRNVYRGVPVPGPMDTPEWFCYVPPYSNEYGQGGSDWVQNPSCDADLSSLRGKPNNDMTSFDFSCSFSQGTMAADGYEEHFEVSGTITLRKPLSNP